MHTILKSGAAALAIAAAVAVGVSINPHQVSAQGKPSVNITLTRNVDERAFNFYQTSHNTFFSVNSVAITEFMPIPAGRTVVVEHVGISGFLATGSVPQAFLRCFMSAEEVNVPLQLASQGDLPNGLTLWTASQPVRCYAGSSTLSTQPLSIHVQTGTFQTLQPSWVVAVSGYAIPN